MSKRPPPAPNNWAVRVRPAGTYQNHKPMYWTGRGWSVTVSESQQLSQQEAGEVVQRIGTIPGLAPYLKTHDILTGAILEEVKV